MKLKRPPARASWGESSAGATIRPAAASILCLGLGLVWGLVFAPPDYQQGESVRIIYVHVPAAWMGMFVYTIVAAASASGM